GDVVVGEVVSSVPPVLGVAGVPGMSMVVVAKSPPVSFPDRGGDVGDVPTEDLLRVISEIGGDQSAGGVVSGVLPMFGSGDVWVAQPADSTGQVLAGLGEVVPVRVAGVEVAVRMGGSAGHVAGATKFWNGVLWPLLHNFDRSGIFYDRYSDREIEEFFGDYLLVNEAVAQTVIDIQSSPDARDLVWVHDYQNFGVGQFLAGAGLERPGYFHHIPWPPPAVLEARIPRHVLAGVVGLFAGYRTVFFHNSVARDNFLDLVERFYPGSVQRERGEIVWPGGVTFVGVSPITTDVGRFDGVRDSAAAAAFEAEVQGLLYPEGPEGRRRRLIYAGGRGDPSKNWPNTIRGLLRAMELDPQVMADVVVVFNEAPTRPDLDYYVQHQREIDRLIGQAQAAGLVVVNKGNSAFGPMVGFRNADIVLLPTHQDGWNLMAEEAVQEAWLNRDKTPRP
ncbi:MAG: trehalose-6-phosphate synthase, partial [Angustibacter sp.]